MKKWLIYVLGIITGIIITFAFALYVNLSNKSGLEMFEEPGDYTEYSQFKVLQVVESGCALAHADDSFDAIVFIIPNNKQRFYDGQKIVLKSDQCAQHVGIYKYRVTMGIEKTVPAIRIIDSVERPKSDKVTTSGKTLFDKPGECVSRKNFEVQKVLESGDAIALEIREIISGHILTSDLEVLILAHEDTNFYNKQVVKAPQGTCARQIGNYKYQKYGTTKVIPIIDFK